MQLFLMWSYLCGRVAQRNIDVLSAEKKVDGRLDDLQNGMEGDDIMIWFVRWQDHRWGEDGMRSLVNTSTLAWTYTGDVGIKEKHKGKNSLHIIVNGQSSIQKVELIQNKKTKLYTIVRNPNGEKDNNKMINGNK
jgi:hypothetical protein